MTDLARIARPWLFSLRQPVRNPGVALSSCLGLGSTHSISTTAACHFKRGNIGAPSRRERNRFMEREALTSFLLPYTIVAPPLSRFPRSPRKFIDMVWLLVKNRITTLGAVLGLYFISMPDRLGWPRFRRNKKNCIPSGKSLHVQMSEAVAAGDKDTLRRICAPELFQTLAGAIDSRPRGTRTEWELVRYEQRWRYPRLADYRISSQPRAGGKGMMHVKQAVVSIASVQRLTRYDDTRGGIKVPGSERERHMIEHFVLQAKINEVTFESEPWKVWGTLPEMTYETILEDKAMFDDAMAQTPQNNQWRG
ncbi:hypothetical protein GGS21DRAFT_141770 [Xylaria nigripes]|nr:hypothetical protein GGS21DRAFT_141770 [Xylaria nigripes]